MIPQLREKQSPCEGLIQGGIALNFTGMGLPACAEARQAGHISGKCRKFAMTIEVTYFL
jgi:hypothetical protein